MSDFLILDNARLLDPGTRSVREGASIAIEGGTVREVGDQPVTSTSARRIDLRGRSVLPGLIDAHCHVMVVDAALRNLAAVPLTLLAARAGKVMRAMLDRGYTSVRDTGGAEWGLKQAVEEGAMVGPRLFISGRPLSQTGGHGDQRLRTEPTLACACSGLGLMTLIADGVDAVRAAAREELRQGVDQIKIMVSGGVISPYDPLESVQYSADEVSAIVDEARRWGRSVTAHAYTADAIRHAVAQGVRGIEHGNLIDADAAQRLAAAGGYMVPTLVAYESLHLNGTAMGLSDAQKGKARAVRDQGLRSVEIAASAGVRLGFGSDLLGKQHHLQSLEFSLRGQVQPAWDVLASATVVNADIVGMTGLLGVIAPGAFADLIVVDGDPLKDLGLLQDPDRYLAAIMKGGHFHKNGLT
jgi:imidazolonepropionase-like amidohydrolase